MNRLREIRLKQGLTQRELAEKSHTPQSLISAIERGDLKPWSAVAHRIARVLGISVSDIFPDDIERLVNVRNY